MSLAESIQALRGVHKYVKETPDAIVEETQLIIANALAGISSKKDPQHLKNTFEVIVAASIVELELLGQKDH